MRWQMRQRSGNMVLETAMWLPVLFLLIAGMVQVGKWTYLDYSLNKILYTAAREVAVQQALNFCDPADPATQAALTDAVNDPATGLPLIFNLTVDMLQVTTQCLDATGAPGACDVSGCSTPAGAQRPDFVTVSLANGYPIEPRIPYILLNPFQLRPSVTVPFDGSSL
jgi:Flp pilus assembly protein TadG